ncbi:transposable element Tc1 transposase [Trichonephila clavipes]|nr:transposable element Tc1 transposase [Trichonephila clavipes]
MDWPAYSLDLNPIEHVWDRLGRRTAARQPPPTCLLELRRALLEEWCNIALDQIDNLILSMPSRSDTVGYGATQQTSHSCALLTKRHRQLRLRWAREHHDWSMDQWERVAWSDESRFVIHHADGRIRIRRLSDEQLFPKCTVSHTQAGGVSITLWGTFSWTFLGPVVVVEQTMNATGYLNIIAAQLHPCMASVFPAGNRMFQQDHTPCHKAKSLLDWFQEYDSEFQLTSWLPNSPDLTQSDRKHLGCHGTAAQSSKTTNSQYL